MGNREKYTLFPSPLSPQPLTPPPRPWPWDRAPRGKHLTGLLIPETTDRSRHSDGDADCRLCAVRGGWERVGCGVFSAGAVGLGRGWGRGVVELIVWAVVTRGYVIFSIHLYSFIIFYTHLYSFIIFYINLFSTIVWYLLFRITFFTFCQCQRF